MNTAKILPFRFESREVRTLLVDDQPWFVAADVSAALEYRDAFNMHRNLDEDEKGTQIVSTPGGEQEMLVINESGLYSAILRSRKAEAKRFKKWVTSEVLPAIRKHGHYEDTQNKLGTLIGKTIGTDGFHILGTLVAGKVRPLPAKFQRSAKLKIWSQLHAAYGVRSAEDIPADQMDSARQFVAAYAIEGEYLPANTSGLPVSRGTLYGLVTHAIQAADLLRDAERGLRSLCSPMADVALSQAEGLRLFSGLIRNQYSSEFEAEAAYQKRLRSI